MWPCYPSAVPVTDRVTGLGAAVVALLALVGCRPTSSVDPEQGPGGVDAQHELGAWELHLDLESRIDAGKVSERERMAVLERVRTIPDDGSAAYAYARASIAGRVAEGRGLKALKILEEMQKWALISIERDPQLEDMAAKRMLGTLYVLAGRHLDEGDSEEGLELLEEVLDAHGDAPINHLRLAEAYIALGDPDPAFELLCTARAGQDQLRARERELLRQLIEDLGGVEDLGCAPQESS